MIKVEHISEPDFEGAVRGMRNPLNSWEKSDSMRCGTAGPGYIFSLGMNDLALMNRLYHAGPEHRKFMRQIFITMDITAPLYWWKEFDQYKVGVTTDSCSTMHTICNKEFTLDDFSTEHLITKEDGDAYDFRYYEDQELDSCEIWIYNIFHADDNMDEDIYSDKICDLTSEVNTLPYIKPLEFMEALIFLLNKCRTAYLNTKDKTCWWQIIQLLPSSYNQRRTVSMSYENAANMIKQRTGHKLDEWNTFVDILRTLPYMEDIIAEKGD